MTHFQGKIEDIRRRRRSTELDVPSYISQQTLKDADQNQALIHWTGYSGKKSSNTIFILTRKKAGSDIINSEFWRSTDYGKNWTQEDYKFNPHDAKEPNVLKSFTISPLGSSLYMYIYYMLYTI